MLCYEYPPIGGGTGIACYHVLQELAKVEGLEIDVVTSHVGPQLVVEQLSSDIRLFKIGLAKKDLSYWTMSEIVQWIRKAHSLVGDLIKTHSYDLCHCWSGWPSGFVGYCFRHSVHYFVSLRGSDIPGYNPRLKVPDLLFFRPLSRIIWRNALMVATISDDSAAMARRTLQMDFPVIRNGMNTTLFYPAHRELDMLKLLFVGRLIERKGVKSILQAVALLSQKYAPSRFHVSIVGSGAQEKELIALGSSLGISKYVTFEGSRQYDFLPAVYRSHDVLIMPSVNEALSNAVYEGVASGLAILTTETGASEILDGNGYLINKNDPADLAARIETLLHDPDTLQRMKNRSAEIAKDISWEQCSKNYLQIYDQLTSGTTTVPDTKGPYKLENGR